MRLWHDSAYDPARMDLFAGIRVADLAAA
ncbi:MAG: hypothetical protein QOJ12_1667, partial [Thermoleophilales bacterium]|nr:hypothetical protein [Thermoleophilales bacterium]